MCSRRERHNCAKEIISRLDRIEAKVRPPLGLEWSVQNPLPEHNFVEVLTNMSCVINDLASRLQRVEALLFCADFVSFDRIDKFLANPTINDDAPSSEQVNLDQTKMVDASIGTIDKFLADPTKNDDASSDE